MTMTKKASLAGKITAGVAGMATLAAGAYYFLGKDGAKHRKTAKAMAEKAKKQVLHELAKMEKTGEAHYHKASTEVLKQYQKLKNFHPEQIAFVKKELASYWQKASKMLMGAQKKPKTKNSKK
jgi:hypothetical protein